MFGSGRGSVRLGGVVGRWVFACVAFLGGGCATTGSTVGSGVGDRLLERAPYYAGRGLDGSDVRLGHLPIVFSGEDGAPGPFDPDTGEGSAVATLLMGLNEHLDLLVAGVSERLVEAVPGRAPDVRFGCERDGFGDCLESEVDDVERRYVYLAVGRPSGEWTSGVAAALDAAGADHVLVISLEVSEYWPRQRNLRGDKEVELGTGHTVRLPWLTALDRPVQVLQLTGAVVDSEGRAVRIGAEGMLPRRTGLLAGSVGLQALITDEEVERLLEARREDLPGSPLVWEVALENLVAGLTAR